MNCILPPHESESEKKRENQPKSETNNVLLECVYHICKGIFTLPTQIPSNNDERKAELHCADKYHVAWTVYHAMTRKCNDQVRAVYRYNIIDRKVVLIWIYSNINEI